MSFGGPINSMINAYKSNVRLLRKRKTLKEIYQNHKSLNREIIQTENVNYEDLKKFQSRLRKERVGERIRFYIILGMTLIIIISLFYWVITADYSEIIELIE